MTLANVYRAIVALAAFATFGANAGEASASSKIQLACPEGAVQKNRSESIFCVKKVSAHREPELHGPYMDLYPNGQKKAEGQYVDGARSGRWTFWEETGVKSGETQFSGGNYHGERTQYFANGNPRMVEQYVNGKRQGLVKEFSEDGKLIRQVQYLNDRQMASK